jgi:hypothetical protein
MILKVEVVLALPQLSALLIELNPLQASCLNDESATTVVFGIAATYAGAPNPIIESAKARHVPIIAILLRIIIDLFL